MILVQGCSFSYGQALKNRLDNRYSKLLEDMLGERVPNIAQEGKCNFVASNELHSYLLHCRYNKGFELPRVIIWQLSDTFRSGVPMSQYSGRWIPNNFIDEISIPYGAKYQKYMLWKAFVNNKEYREPLDDEEAWGHSKKNGVGTFLTYYRGDGKQYHDRWAIGDVTNQYNELQTVLAIHKIQELCRSLGVQLVIVNYYGTPAHLLEDATYKAINRDNYLIKNSEKFGLYNHLMWRGFNRPDVFHFDVDAHYYQADVLYNYLTTGEQIVVEEEEHGDVGLWPVFDYVHGEFDIVKK